MSEQCGETVWVELPDGDTRASCTLPNHHPESHRAVITWSGYVSEFPPDEVEEDE